MSNMKCNSQTHKIKTKLSFSKGWGVRSVEKIFWSYLISEQPIQLHKLEHSFLK